MRPIHTHLALAFTLLMGTSSAMAAGVPIGQAIQQDHDVAYRATCIIVPGHSPRTTLRILVLHDQMVMQRQANGDVVISIQRQRAHMTPSAIDGCTIDLPDVTTRHENILIAPSPAPHPPAPATERT